MKQTLSYLFKSLFIMALWVNPVNAMQSSGEVPGERNGNEVNNMIKSHDLNALFNLALQHNPALARVESQKNQALNALQQTKAEGKVEVRLKSELSYTVMSEKAFARTSNQVEATYPLYEPQLNDKIQGANLTHQSQQWRLEAEKQAVLSQVVERYLSYWQQQQRLIFQHKEQASIESIMQQVQQRFQVGFQDLNDIVEIQSRLDFNLVERLTAQQTLEEIEAFLLADIGLENGRLFNVEGLVFPTASLPNLETLRQKINTLLTQQTDQVWLKLTAQNPKLLAIEQQTLAVRQQVAFARNNDGMKVEAFGAYVLNESDNNFYDDMRGARAGLRLSVPLYLGGQTKASVAQKSQQVLQNQASKREVALKIAAEAYKAWRALQSSQQRLNALKSALNSSKQAVTSSKQSLKTGRRNVLDLLDAQRLVHRIQRDIPIVEAQVWKSYYQLLFAMGTLKVGA